MQNEISGPAPERVFAVHYERFSSRLRNPELRGKGTLTVRQDGSFSFSGTRRGSMPFGAGTVLEVRPEQVWNVEARCVMVQFATSVGNASPGKRSFVFFCRTEGAAKDVVALLPAVRDAEFAAAINFTERVRNLGGAATPWTSVTNLIIGANVLVFVVMGFLGAGWLEAAGIMPYARFGANNAAATTDGQWWRLLTSMFMHFGVLHLSLNMWALYQAGHFLEKLQGRRLYALTYFGSGIAGGLASMAWHGDRMWSAGASGAIFGVYGALLGYLLREEHKVPRSVFGPLMKSTLSFAGYNLVYGMIHSGIDNAAHVGGLFGGFALGWVTALPTDPEIRARFESRRLRAGIIAAVAMTALGVVVAPRFDYDPLEELAWRDANLKPAAKEREVVTHQNSEINTYRSTGETAKLGIWLTYEAIPFYEGWRSQILTLPLKQGQRTQRQRDALARIIEMKVDSYRHLLSAMNGPEPYPLRRFDEDSKAVQDEIARLPAR